MAYIYTIGLKPEKFNLCCDHKWGVWKFFFFWKESYYLFCILYLKTLFNTYSSCFAHHSAYTTTISLKFWNSPELFPEVFSKFGSRHTPTAVLLIYGGLQKILGVWDVEELHIQSVVIHHQSCFHSSCQVCIPDCSPYTESPALGVNHL